MTYKPRLIRIILWRYVPVGPTKIWQVTSTPTLGESTDRQTELEIILQHSIPSRVYFPLLEGASRITEDNWFQKNEENNTHNNKAINQPCPILLPIDR